MHRQPICRSPGIAPRRRRGETEKGPPIGGCRAPAPAAGAAVCPRGHQLRLLQAQQVRLLERLRDWWSADCAFTRFLPIAGWKRVSTRAVEGVGLQSMKMQAMGGKVRAVVRPSVSLQLRQSLPGSRHRRKGEEWFGLDRVNRIVVDPALHQARATKRAPGSWDRLFASGIGTHNTNMGGRNAAPVTLGCGAYTDLQHFAGRQRQLPRSWWCPRASGGP